MPAGDRKEIEAAQAEVDPDLFPPTPRGGGQLNRSRLMILLAVALGGAAGTPARYAIGRIVPPGANGFPWSTFLINITGSFALGVVLTLIIERWPPTRYVRPFVAIGFIGAYTTFSTLMVETDVLIKDGNVGIGIVYVTATLLAGLAALYLGVVAVRLLPTTRGANR